MKTFITQLNEYALDPLQSLLDNGRIYFDFQAMSYRSVDVVTQANFNDWLLNRWRALFLRINPTMVIKRLPNLDVSPLFKLWGNSNFFYDVDTYTEFGERNFLYLIYTSKVLERKTIYWKVTNLIKDFSYLTKIVLSVYWHLILTENIANKNTPQLRLDLNNSVTTTNLFIPYMSSEEVGRLFLNKIKES